MSSDWHSSLKQEPGSLNIPAAAAADHILLVAKTTSFPDIKI